MSEYINREEIRAKIAEEAAYWDATDTSELMEQETEWFTFEPSEREDRCPRCGGRMEERRIDVHLAEGRVTVHDAVWYVCRTPGCGHTQLASQSARLLEAIEEALHRLESPSPAKQIPMPLPLQEPEPVPA